MRSASIRASVISALVVLAAGCGAQNGTVPTVSSAQSGARQRSGSSGALIYVATTKHIVILSYPGGQIIGTIPWYGVRLDNSICSDPSNGNVFVPENNAVYEYGHGSTTPSTILAIPYEDQYPSGCTVDPKTGDLAVIAATQPTGRDGFLVYPGGTGTPVTYMDNKVNALYYAAYDASGDLFSVVEDGAGGQRLAELRHGQTKFNFLKFANCGCSWSKLQWDGKYLALAYFPGSQRSIAQLSLGRTTATLINSVNLSDMANRDGGNFWIYNGSVFAEYQKLRRNNNQGVGVWAYPAGGDTTARIFGSTKGPKDGISDLTVSVAPTASQPRK